MIHSLIPTLLMPLIPVLGFYFVKNSDFSISLNLKKKTKKGLKAQGV